MTATVTYIKQVLSQAPETYDEDKLEEIFNELILLDHTTKFDSKHYKKLYRLCLWILKLKGTQISTLQEDIKGLTSKQIQLKNTEPLIAEELNEEISQLKTSIEKLELDKAHYKNKTREQAQEINILQRRLQENAQDDDSGDALSELDKQQELLNNINIKNKHIKRLLRDIEELEAQNVNQSRLVSELQSVQRDSNLNLATLSQQFHESQVIINKQSDTIQQNILEIESLKERLAKAALEKQEINKEVEAFKKQLEERALIWKNILETKDLELKNTKEKYDDLIAKHPGYNIDQERTEFHRLSVTIIDKDKAMHNLEGIIKLLNTEILELKDQITTLTTEKSKLEAEKIDSKSGKCCSMTKQLLEKSNERCQEFQEMLTNIEADNMLKAKQAFEAIETLKSYEKGQYGLPDALTKINKLQDKLSVRENKIKELITEVNQANELGMENCILRKRLGIPIDDVISTKNFVAKQKRFEKVNEKLTLKLRAYEEMLLQLKLERNELRRELASDKPQKVKRKKQRIETGAGDTLENVIDDDDDLSGSEDPNSTEICEKCFKQYESNSKLKSCPSCYPKSKVDAKVLKENYEKVLEENENLRIGMHEILHKLREFDATSSQITIDTSTLERVLHALDARSISGWYHPAMRMQNELMVTKEREMALLERIRLNEEIIMKYQKGKQIGPSEVQPGPSISHESPTKSALKTKVNQLESELQSNSDQLNKYKTIMESDDQNQTELLAENDRLRIVEKQYNEVMLILEKSDNEKDQLIVSTLKNVNEIEIQMSSMHRKFDYLKQDNINLINGLKKIKLDNVNLLHDLKKDLAEKSKEIELSKLNQVSSTPEGPTIENLQQEIHRLKLELSSSCSQIFKNLGKTFEGNDNVEMDLNKIQNVAIIKENLAIDYITINELNALKETKDTQEKDFKDLKVKNKHLEDVICILNEQLSAQQKLIMKQSDEEISLRHLVADLQSTSEDNYLLVRTKKELDLAHSIESDLKTENEKIQKLLHEADEKLHKKENDRTIFEKQYLEKRKNDSLKIKFLTKTLISLRDSYMLYTPLYAITDFLKLYNNVKELRNVLENKIRDTEKGLQDLNLNGIEDYLKKLGDSTDMQIKIQALKLQSQCDYLSKNLSEAEAKIEVLKHEVTLHAMKDVESSEHWNTIRMLFDDTFQKQKSGVHKEIQAQVKTISKGISTEDAGDEKGDDQERSDSIKASPHRKFSVRQLDAESVAHALSSHESLKTQLKQALSLASARSALLLETETRLAEAHGRVRSLEKNIEDKDTQLKSIKDSTAPKTTTERKEDNILTITIASLQNLLLEKDTTLSRYRELLETERQEHSKAYEDQVNEGRKLRRHVEELEHDLSKKNDQLKQYLERPLPSPRRTMNETISSHSDTDDSIKGSVEKHTLETTKEDHDESRRKIRSLEDDVKKLHTQLEEVSNREKIWEKNLNEKENEIHKLREKLHFTQPDGIEITENIITRREIEQLRELVDEKDRHIQDLTDTLSHFHDDQQRFIHDTDIHSTEQVTQLSVELNRCDASNKILKTQLDAMKRQLSNVTQRENQARDLIKNLKAQLIRRPVISVKSDSLMSVREEQLRKKNQQLEIELDDVKEELSRLKSLNDHRRAKSASDLGLWEKQKRWQQTAEKLKEKLNEREAELDKLRATLTTAKNSIARLEREKHILEQRRLNHYCTSASCPNLHQASKDSPAESPESYITSSVTPEKDHGGVAAVNVLNEQNRELVEALKNRVEAQQRRIVALELEGKGSNAMTIEIEKLHEVISNLQGQNVRLEAKNLQYQLENDKLKQGNNTEMLQKQIKHLEDYIGTMKNELIRAKTGLDVTKEALQAEISKNEQLEKTIVTLRNMVDKLSSEVRPRSGKNVASTSKSSQSQLEEKSDKRSTVSHEMYETLQTEFNNMQKSYTQLTEKLSSMQIELQLQTGMCSQCGGRRYSSSSSSDGIEDDQELEIKRVRSKLGEKSRLLEKAKILLTRAAAKEKNLREQIAYLRRRCSELQNVPVIEETSE